MDTHEHIVAGLERKQTDLFAQLHIMLSEFKRVKGDSEAVLRDLKRLQVEYGEAHRRLRTLENMSRMMKLTIEQDPSVVGYEQPVVTGWTPRGPMSSAPGRKNTVTLAQNHRSPQSPATLLTTAASAAAAAGPPPDAAGARQPVTDGTAVVAATAVPAPKRIGVKTVEPVAMPRSRPDPKTVPAAQPLNPVVQPQPQLKSLSQSTSQSQPQHSQPTFIGGVRRPGNKAPMDPLPPLPVATLTPAGGAAPSVAAAPATSVNYPAAATAAASASAIFDDASVRMSSRPDVPVRRSYALSHAEDLQDPAQWRLPSNINIPKPTQAPLPKMPEPHREIEDPVQEMNANGGRSVSGPVKAVGRGISDRVKGESKEDDDGDGALDLSSEMAAYGASMWIGQPAANASVAAVASARELEDELDLLAISSEMQSYASSMWAGPTPSPATVGHDALLSQVDEVVAHISRNSSALQRSPRASAATAPPVSAAGQPHVQSRAHASIAFDPDVLHEMQSYASSLWSETSGGGGGGWSVPQLYS